MLKKKPRYVFFGMFSVQFILYSIIKPSFIWPKALDIFFKQLCDSLFNFYWIYLKTQKFRQCVQITEKNTEAKRLLEYEFIHMLTPHPTPLLVIPALSKESSGIYCYPSLFVRPYERKTLSLELRLHFKDLRNYTLESQWVCLVDAQRF